MKKQPIDTPFAIRLQATNTYLPLYLIFTEIYLPMMEDICEKLSRYGDKFSMDSYLRPQIDVDKLDFRFDLLEGSIPEPPCGEKKHQRYRQALLAEMGAMSQQLHEAVGRYCDESLAFAERTLAKSKRALEAKCPDLPLSKNDMMWYLGKVLELRLWRMLDNHIKTGRLVITPPPDSRFALRDPEVASLDNLVTWAVSLRITIEQDSLPGCPPLVQAAYSRLHQCLASPSLFTDVTAESANAAPPTLRSKNRWDEPELKRLLDKSREPGMTHEKLAEHYGVSRPLISRMLKKAEEQIKPRHANAFNLFRSNRSK